MMQQPVSASQAKIISHAVWLYHGFSPSLRERRADLGRARRPKRAFARSPRPPFLLPMVIADHWIASVGLALTWHPICVPYEMPCSVRCAATGKRGLLSHAIRHPLPYPLDGRKGAGPGLRGLSCPRLRRMTRWSSGACHGRMLPPTVGFKVKLVSMDWNSLIDVYLSGANREPQFKCDRFQPVVDRTGTVHHEDDPVLAVERAELGLLFWSRGRQPGRRVVGRVRSNQAQYPDRQDAPEARRRRLGGFHRA
jgi:hypothetical protein